MVSKTVVVIDREHSSQAIFFWMDVKRISCITEDAAKAKKEMRIEDIVIDTSLAADATIFQIPLGEAACWLCGWM